MPYRYTCIATYRSTYRQCIRKTYHRTRIARVSHYVSHAYQAEYRHMCIASVSGNVSRCINACICSVATSASQRVSVIVSECIFSVSDTCIATYRDRNVSYLYRNHIMTVSWSYVTVSAARTCIDTRSALPPPPAAPSSGTSASWRLPGELPQQVPQQQAQHQLPQQQQRRRTIQHQSSPTLPDTRISMYRHVS